MVRNLLDNFMILNELTPEEERVIVKKGTEAPYSGEYENFNDQGVFTCRRCGAFLYRSADKFDAHCGWPSFDREILGAVTRQLDADGRRTEILCRRCGAHLGHVFVGERLTPQDTRHCVNSVSLKFLAEKLVPKSESAYLGGGCFWCIEAVFKMIKGVESEVVGYAGGKSEKAPVYEDVCSGAFGHAEVVKIEFNPSIISYEALLEIFFSAHNPTTLNRQGADIGFQYRSIILYKDDLQKEIAEKFIKDLTGNNVFADSIVTELKQLTTFYEAENYHKDYFSKNPQENYCQMVIGPKISKLREKLKKYLK